MEDDEAATEKTTKTRIFVGGLAETVTADDLQRIFVSLGAVEGIEVVRTKGRSFAYVDFSPSSLKSLSKLFSAYNGCVWKGGRLKLEKAKEHYLVRFERERAEESELASRAELAIRAPSNDFDANEDMASSRKFKKVLNSETPQLRMYFPSLRKVKSVPLSGTGKHKYSFQRVEVPPLPIHFCDCEEHSVDFLSAKEKQTCDVEAQSRGMNEEEINIMNSVMNKLFKREKVSDTAHSGNGLTKERDNSAKSIHGLQVDEYEADSATDEDNLIINVVTRKSNKMALFGGQEKERISENQDSGFSGTRTSRDGQNQNALKEQKRNTVPPNKKRKSLNQESDDNGSLSAITRGKGKLKTHSDESAALLGAQLAKPDSGIQKSDTVVYWSQKSSWRNLVGDKGNTSFSVSHILPSEEQQPKNGSSVSDSIVSKNKNLVRHGDHLESHLGETIEEEVMETQPAKPSAASSKSVSDFIVSKNENLVIHGDHLESPSGETIEEEEVTETQPAKPSAASSKSVSDSIVNKNENLVTHGDHLESLSGETIEEVVTETQPAKTSAASSKSGRGASWLKKSSWTQLISENNNSSFSIAQVLPGISYEKQVQVEPNNVDIVDSTNGEHSDLRKDDNTKSPGNVSTILVIEKDRNIVRSTPEKNQQTVVGNNEAPSPISERKLNSAPKVTSARSITIGETCSFMRSAASLKEWSKVKASVSGSLKRKSGGK